MSAARRATVEDVKEIRLNIRATAEELLRWQETAARGGRTLSQLVRWLLDKETEATAVPQKKKK